MFAIRTNSALYIRGMLVIVVKEAVASIHMKKTHTHTPIDIDLSRCARIVVLIIECIQSSTHYNKSYLLLIELPW